MQDTLTGSSIAKETYSHIILIQILVGKSDTCTEADLCTHDTMPAKKTMLLREEVHRASLPLGAACSLAKKFGHGCIAGDTLGDTQAVVAVGCDHPVICSER